MEVGAHEAKADLGSLLERARRGETTTISKHGVPVARLVPPAPCSAGISDVVAAFGDSACDAWYADLAAREGPPPATLDRAMAEAARAEGIPEPGTVRS